MTRLALTCALLLSLTVAVRAADLPVGTWAANVDGKTGDLVITSVKDGKVSGSLLGTDFTGFWRDKTLTFELGGLRHEAQLVSEPAEKGKTKYTLTGTREERMKVPTRVVIHIVKTGWYAQLISDAPPPPPPGEIKAEVRGVLVVEGTRAYVSVKRKNAFGEVEETKIHVYASEGEWKGLKQTLPPLNGKEVVVKASLAQMTSKGASIPEGALYFLGKFEPRFAGGE